MAFRHALFTTVLMALGAVCTLAQSPPSISTINTIEVVANTRIYPFSAMPTPNYAPMDGATVNIEVGYLEASDALYFDYQGSFNITSDFDDKRGILFISGMATVSEYMMAIASVSFITTSETFTPRRITWSMGNYTIYNSLTRHFYRMIRNTNVLFPDAASQCAATSGSIGQFFGMQGYLASITSDAEQQALGSKLPFTAWIGLQMDVPGAANVNWTWVGGPEAGTKAWTGLSMYQGGAAYPTNAGVQYTSWGRFQPTESDGTGNSFVAMVPSSFSATARWSNINQGGVAGYICEYGGSPVDTATVEANAQYYAGSVVASYSCALLTDSNSCNNLINSGCQWQAGTCIQTKCGEYQTEKDCDGDSRCSWATDGLIGVCTNTHCSAYTNADTCLADPLCTLVQTAEGISYCADATCDMLGTPATCDAMEDCAWLRGTARCANLNAVGCTNLDIVYLLDSSVAMDQPFETFTGGFQGLTDVLMAAQFSFTGTGANVSADSVPGVRVGFVRYGTSATVTPSGTGSGGRLSGRTSQVQADLQYMQTGFSPSATASIGDALTAANGMFNDGSAKNRTRVIVVVAAGAISDAKTLSQSVSSNILGTLSQAGTKIFGIVLSATQSGTTNSMAAAASLSLLTRYTTTTDLPNFATVGVYSLCSPTGVLGAWLGTAPTTDPAICSNYATPDACSTSAHCSWSYSADACAASACLQYGSAQSCSAAGTCTWSSSGNICLELCASQTMGGCNSMSSLCFYNSAVGVCQSLPCFNNPTEDACISDPNNCYYNASAGTPCQPKRCTYASATECYANPSCSYSQTYGCFYNPCSQIWSKTTCTGIAECKWASQKCQLHECSVNRVESTCNANFNCYWSVDVSPPTCMPATCTGYNNQASTAQANCNAANVNGTVCYWDNVDPSAPARCEMQVCGNYATSCGCATMEGCVWRNNQCKDARYVQCPAIDVMFLIEATSNMNKAFGRHPDGFIGIVESIRSWSEDAPFATGFVNDTSATGFRMAIALYGAPNTAQTVPTDVGAGNAFTASMSQWNGAGAALDVMESSQKVYAQNASNNIWPGLQVATRLFTDATSPPARTRVLVILGANPITDTDSNVRTMIQSLEAANVQIFSNVMRRFSTITPIETRAAEFLQPLASDPLEEHFLFTTIDSMRSTLLDGFCDPSTDTGKALSINRDRTLPCNWLETKTECNMQTSCFWNSTATPTCPQSNQCPNLGCTALPTALAAKFRCDQCTLTMGALSCSYSTVNTARPGLCQASSCLLNCDEATCNSNSACTYIPDSLRCEINMCQPGMSLAACNANLGCVYDEQNYNPPQCRRSQCWTWREGESCSAAMATANGNSFAQCQWLSTNMPAVCQERVCQSLGETTCKTQSTTCTYDAVATGAKCNTRECAYTNAEECEYDANCYWNAYGSDNNGEVNPPGCYVTTPNCVISVIGEWNSSQCSSSCGPTAVRFRERRIVKYADPFTATALSCDVVLAVLNPPTMFQSQPCDATTMPGWNTDCTSYCGGFAIPDQQRQCIMDQSCQSTMDGCTPRQTLGCEWRSQTDCAATDLCTWNARYGYCSAAVTTCIESDPSVCVKLSNCAWRTGTTAIQYAAGYGMTSQLINPGQAEIFPFSLLQLSTTDNKTIDGATVTIETGYQLGRDFLSMNIPITGVSTEWVAQSGTLRINGVVSVAAMGQAIRAVAFETTSTSPAPRMMSWSLGKHVVYSGQTGSHYVAVQQAGVTWDQAVSACASSSFFGLTGYLATVNSSVENTVISSKLAGDGWLGGDDRRRSTWQWSTGPLAGRSFWSGLSALSGGTVVTNMYANWDPIAEEPTVNLAQGNNRLYLNASGYWKSHDVGFASAVGYVCEFGGMPNDNPPTAYAIGGSTVIGVGGCMPLTCQWHQTAALCRADPDCDWIGECVSGCGSRSTANDCASSDRCHWNTDVLPPVCEINPCNGLGGIACSTTAQCQWDTTSGSCTLRSGCAAYTDLQSCGRQKFCQWSTASTPASCIQRACDTLQTQADCAQLWTCRWTTDGVCTTSLCSYTEEAACDADQARCLWVGGNDTAATKFTPSSGVVVYPFQQQSLVAPGDSSAPINGITVSISQGFQVNMDKLVVTGTVLPSTFTSTYYAATGVLVLSVIGQNVVQAGAAFDLMQKYVGFTTSSGVNVQRQISYVLGAYAVQATGNVVMYVPTTVPVTSYADAQALCAQKTFFNVSGALATITDELTNIGLANMNAHGWIDATGKYSGGITDWYWAGDTTNVFWQVLASGLGQQVMGANGNYRYAQWTSSQPPQQSDSVPIMYGFMMADSNNPGKWTAISPTNTLSIDTGVLCQFTNPSSIVASTAVILPQGCFAKPCLSLSQAQCSQDTQCYWTFSELTGGTCSQDMWCSRQVTPSDCRNHQQCYWSYTNAQCTLTPTSVCFDLNETECSNTATYPRCVWDSTMARYFPPGSTIPAGYTGGACATKGCSPNPTRDSCNANPMCRWYSPTVGVGVCVNRDCGYTSASACWADTKCLWDSANIQCVISDCARASAADCGQYGASCAVVDGMCAYQRCKNAVTSQDDQACLFDAACLIENMQCYMPDCTKYSTQGACNADPRCFYFVSLTAGVAPYCSAAQCTNHPKDNCNPSSANTDPCRWDANTGACRQASAQEMASKSAGTCEREVEPSLWWMYLLLVLILLLIAAIIYRLYLAYAKGISFFDPPRKNITFNAQARYAADLFDEAKKGDGAIDTNSEPNLNDL